MVVGRLKWFSSPRSTTAWLAVYLHRTMRMVRTNSGMKRSSLDLYMLRRQKIARARDTNCDIFSWASSQFAVCAWNMAAMAAASSSGVLTAGMGAYNKLQRNHGTHVARHSLVKVASRAALAPLSHLCRNVLRYYHRSCYTIRLLLLHPPSAAVAAGHHRSPCRCRPARTANPQRPAK